MERYERVALFNETMKGVEISNEFAEWLVLNGFFTAPASTKYHGAYEGGLFEHSKNVTDFLVELTAKNNLKWSRPESPLIVGMFHDLCKIDNYRKCEGGWEYNTDCPYVAMNDKSTSAHGDKSVAYLCNFMSLTVEEQTCIRYHMGAFTPKEEWSDYTGAIHVCPNVLWTHHADMLASHIKEVRDEAP